jgi:aldehyde dehydrogenase (NAD+)
MTKQQGTISNAGLDQQFIGGKWRTGRSEHKLLNHNPFTGGVIFEMAQADRLDLEDAYTVAASSFRGWAGTMPETRSSIFRRVASIMEHRREEIISWLIQESGSTRLKASLEYETTRAIMLSSAATPYEVAGRILKTDVPNKEGRVYRKPVGVVGVISPWNWPLHLSARSVAPALSVGNAVVLKPASDTPVTGGLLLAKLFEEASLPAGVFNVIVGSGSEIGDSFVTHPVPRVISFTGSTPIGRRVGELAAKAPIIKRTELELGGNSPFVVLDDADLNHVIDAAIFGKFLHQGQICMAVNRFIVDDSLYEDFVEFFVEKAKALNVGDPAKPDTMIGPIINESQLNKLKERAEDAGSREQRSS